MEPILAGIETEYGLYVEGRGAEKQVDDATALVRNYPGKRFLGWDYRHESPRADLRGFRVDRLAFDPEDARFDEGQARGPDSEVRADQILPNGARFYNDHGHPEYATPECLSSFELALHDLAGERVVRGAAESFAQSSGHICKLYKNNTDFHGASYGCHESYLVPRAVGFEALYAAVMPILIARQVLCGAGKVGAEQGAKCEYQLSQRADFLVDAVSLETLYRRSLFNTRDEPHADPSKWIRLHVICGDANMIPSATRRKVGLIKLAIALLRIGEAPEWRIPHPVEAFASVSKDAKGEFRIELGRNSWTTAFEILESYFSAGEKALGIRAGTEQDGLLGELGSVIVECRDLIEAFGACPELFREKVDWAAKKWLLDQVREEEGWDWSHPALRSYDLEYHNIDPAEGLYFALAEEGRAEARPPHDLIESRVEGNFEPTRAAARGHAVERFATSLQTACWRSLTFRSENGIEEVELPPDAAYPKELGDERGVEGFIQKLRSLQ